MDTHRITGALAALVVAGALVSCAADAQPEAAGAKDGKGKAVREDRGERTQVGERRPARSGQARSGGRPGKSAGSPPATPAESGAAGSTAGAQGSGPEEGAPTARSSCTDDPTGDLDSSGEAPSYADVTGGCLRAEAQRLILEARTVGGVPVRMPDRDTQLSYGFELTTPSGSTTYVHAQASPEGWSAYVSRRNSQRQIDPPTIDGDRVVLILPLAELGDAERVQWVLEASWLESGLLSTEYAFDGAPNGGAVRFER